jgi:hypothetical protein
MRRRRYTCWCTENVASELHLGGMKFESWLGYWMSLTYSWEISGLNLGHDLYAEVTRFRSWSSFRICQLKLLNFFPPYFLIDSVIMRENFRGLTVQRRKESECWSNMETFIGHSVIMKWLLINSYFRFRRS